MKRNITKNFFFNKIVQAVFLSLIMGKFTHNFFRKCAVKPYNKRRKQWIKNITRQIITSTPTPQQTYKYPLPVKNWPLTEILDNENKRNMSVQNCYIYGNLNPDHIMRNVFPICQYIKDEPIKFIEKFILSNINFYISMFDDRIIAFIDSLYHDLWRLILLILISAPVIDQHQNELKSINRIYLDEYQSYIIERLFLCNTQTIYKLCSLFNNFRDTITEIHEGNEYKNCKILQDISLSVHLEPFKDTTDLRYIVYKERLTNKQKYISFRFHVPKVHFVNQSSHREEIEKHTLMVLKERTKRIN